MYIECRHYYENEIVELFTCLGNSLLDLGCVRRFRHHRKGMASLQSVLEVCSKCPGPDKQVEPVEVHRNLGAVRTSTPRCTPYPIRNTRTREEVPAKKSVIDIGRKKDEGNNMTSSFSNSSHNNSTPVPSRPSTHPRDSKRKVSPPSRINNAFRSRHAQETEPGAHSYSRRFETFPYVNGSWT